MTTKTKTRTQTRAAKAATSRAEGLLRPRLLDICLGRGGMANNHPGNKKYRDIATIYKFQYLDAELRRDKGIVVKDVMNHLAREGYRFVQKVNGLWYPAPQDKARAKVIQALREFAFELRNELEAPASPAHFSPPHSPRTSAPPGVTTTVTTSTDGASVVTMESLDGSSLDVPSCEQTSSSENTSEGATSPHCSTSSFDEDMDTSAATTYFQWDLEPLPISSDPNYTVEDLEPLPISSDPNHPSDHPLDHLDEFFLDYMLQLLEL